MSYRGAIVGLCLVAGVALAAVGPNYGAVGNYSGGDGKGTERGTTYVFRASHHGLRIHRRPGVVVCDIGPNTRDRSTCTRSRLLSATYYVRLAAGQYQKIAYIPGMSELCHANSPNGPVLTTVSIHAGSTTTVNWYCRFSYKGPLDIVKSIASALPVTPAPAPASGDDACRVTSGCLPVQRPGPTAAPSSPPQGLVCVDPTSGNCLPKLGGP